jgi:hypothetical protein
MNYRDDDYVISYLYGIAKTTDVDSITIDILEESIFPYLFEFKLFS